ncbi:MAG: hypothetical protein WBA12_03095 [Catalinimonas sp.]
MPLPKKLQEAVLAMPTKEKDKLLLRLLARDEKLVAQLQYKLVEDGDTLEARRRDIRETIEDMATGYHYSPGWMMMDMRSVNAIITRHVRTTKDKAGEIELTLLMLNKVYDHQMEHLKKSTGKTGTISSYIVKRAQFVLNKLAKLHEDYLIEYEDDVNRLLERIHTTAPAQEAADAGLPRRFR